MTTQQELWIGVAVSEDSAAAFTSAGELLHSDAAAEKELVYFTEAANGTLELLTPADFRQRIAEPARSLAP